MRSRLPLAGQVPKDQKQNLNRQQVQRPAIAGAVVTQQRRFDDIRCATSLKVRLGGPELEVEKPATATRIVKSAPDVPIGSHARGAQRCHVCSGCHDTQNVGARIECRHWTYFDVESSKIDGRERPAIFKYPIPNKDEVAG